MVTCFKLTVHYFLLSNRTIFGDAYNIIESTQEKTLKASLSK